MKVIISRSKFKKEELFGIKETKEVFIALIDLLNTVDEAAKDGWNLADALKFIDPLSKLPNAISGAENIPKELKDMSEEEKAELIAEIDQLDFDSAYSEAIGEEGLIVLLHIAKLLSIIRKAKLAKK